MQTVTVSSSYRISIPKKFREKHHMVPGAKFILLSVGDRIEMVPEKDIESLHGILAGMDSEPERDKKDRI
ncbi:MAG: AbrB/MazE/SpoVT family DNA-binding domain-containing protein [bacterium]|nr:AbrB/MazE/SpoVT family DNA-binding domain-containing protein [bacterium]